MEIQPGSTPEQYPDQKQENNHYDLFPTPEDWIALQGGKPRVFMKPHSPQASWLVLHVYDEHPDENQRFQSGVIVETIPPDLNTAIHGVIISGRDKKREIILPSFMNRKVHGDPCDLRSRIFGGFLGYNRIKDQRKYELFLDFLANHEWEELRFGVTKDGFQMQRLPSIRPAKPLG